MSWPTELNEEIIPRKASGIFGLYEGPPFIHCPRCHYVGEAAGASFDFFDLLALVPPAGHFLYLILRGNKKKESGLRCPMCDYDEIEVIPEEDARARLGNSRFEQIVEQRKMRLKREMRTALLLFLVVAGTSYLLLHFWRNL